MSRQGKTLKEMDASNLSDLVLITALTSKYWFVLLLSLSKIAKTNFSGVKFLKVYAV